MAGSLKRPDPSHEQRSFSHTFRHVYRFILWAVRGDTALQPRSFRERAVRGITSASHRCVQEDESRSRQQEDRSRLVAKAWEARLRTSHGSCGDRLHGWAYKTRSAPGDPARSRWCKSTTMKE